MKTIFYGGAALLLIGLALLVPALQLIPTDLGNTYLLGSIILMASGVIVWAIGTAGGTILHEIKVLKAIPVSPIPAEEPVMSLPPIPLSPPVEEAKSSGTSAAVVAAGAGAAAGMVAGALIGGATRADSAPRMDDRLLDDLERDLFADIAKGEAKPAEAAPAETPADEPDSAEAKEVVAEEVEDTAFLLPNVETAPDTGEDDVEPATEPVEEDSPALAIEDEHAPAEEPVAEPVTIEEPETAEPEPVEPEAPAPAPGLIADEDLAALEDAEPDLAPLETLEIVGAYDSGGTRFTMYSDGSVTAQGAGVDRRFKSLDDLRAFIDGGMKG